MHYEVQSQLCKFLGFELNSQSTPFIPDATKQKKCTTGLQEDDSECPDILSGRSNSSLPLTLRGSGTKSSGTWGYSQSVNDLEDPMGDIPTDRFLIATSKTNVSSKKHLIKVTKSDH